MATTSRLERPPAALCPPDRPRAPRAVPRRRGPGRLPRTAVRRAPRSASMASASMASFRWALAFYGGFLFIAVAMAAAVCSVP